LRRLDDNDGELLADDDDEDPSYVIAIGGRLTDVVKGAPCDAGAGTLDFLVAVGNFGLAPEEEAELDPDNDSLVASLKV